MLIRYEKLHLGARLVATWDVKPKELRVLEGEGSMHVWPIQDLTLQCYKVFIFHNASLDQKDYDLQSQRWSVEPIDLVELIFDLVLGISP